MARLKKIIFFTFIAYFIYLCIIYFLVYQSSKNIVDNYNNELLRVKIYGSTTTKDSNTISGTFSIVDSNSNEIAKIERSWSGSYLAVEFIYLHLNDKLFIFPNSIYGKNHIYEKKKKMHGTSLEKYYIEQQQCLLLGYESSFQERYSLYILSTYANGYFCVPKIFKCHYYSVDLSNCKNEKHYSICRNNNGDLYVKEF